MNLDEDTQREIERHALSCYPRESCGLVFECAGILRYLRIPNVADEPERHFEPHPRLMFAAIEAAERRGEHLVAVAHSHPNARAEPSERDRRGSALVPHNIIVGFEWDDVHLGAAAIETRVYGQNYAEEIAA